MEKIITFFLACLVVFGDCTRFQREELGVPDRLRFTSGKNTYYNCDIINGQLVSNLKIGVHIYNHKSLIRFAINDTNFNVTSEKVQDFYFSHVRIIKRPTNLDERVVKLVAKDDSGIFIDETMLRINSPKIITSSAPIFVNNSETNIVVYDDVFVGSTIGHLLITNQDVPVIYYLDQKDSITLREFGVTVDGSIIVTKRLDHERKSNFRFQVHAKHATVGPSASMTLTVTVKEGTNPKKTAELRRLYQPLINQKPKSGFSVSNNQLLKFSLSELAPQQTMLGGIGVKPDQIRYVIGDGNEGQAFKIDSETGIISVNNESQIDFEKKKKYTLEINDSPKIFHISKIVEVTILDENDNSPIFTEAKYTATIDENASMGKIVAKVSASDKDSGSNGLVHFTFSNKVSHPFSILLDGTITVAGSLDLISQNSIHYLYVKALDMGQPIRRETETLVEVHIKSINNHKPVLRNLNCDIFYNVERKNEELFKLEAVDQDVSNSITFNTVEKSKDIFINQSSGVVYWKGGLSQPTTVKLNFLAFDGLYTSDRMQVTIRFVNEESSILCQPNAEYENVEEKLERKKLLPKPEKKPLITPKPNSKLSFVQTPGSSVYISESSDVGTFVGKYRVLNPNPKSYGIVLYTIVNGNHEGKFNIDLHNGTLFLRSKLDREKTSQYRLEVEASDGASESITTVLEVEVGNVDDTPPVFEKNGKYSVQVKEKENIGRTIATVKANAVGDYGLTYSLVTPSTIFEVDGKTGVVRLKSSLTKQPYKEYFIEIQAANQTMLNPMYGYAVVHVTVIGLANHPPLCLIEEQRIEISTSTLAGVIIGRVFAHDVDEGKAGKVTFAVKNKDNTHFDDYFSINRKSGLITLKKDLSVHDKGIVFRIQIEVSDQGKPALSTICHLYKIIVDDVGATQPSFLHTKYPVAASIPYNSSRGTFVTKLKAVLPGNETSQNIRYSLIDGSGIGLFTIDSVLGSIYVSDNTTVMPFYWLTVQAYMFSDSSSFKNTHVLIQVSGQQHGSLYFKPSVYHVNLNHKEEVSRHVVQLYVTDGAGRYNLKGLKYTVHAGDNKESFTIDTNGLMTTKDILDMGVYHLNVTVSNPNNKTILSYGYVVLDVRADNSEPPVFSGSVDISQPVSIFTSTTRGFNPPYLFQVLALNPSAEERIIYQSTDTDIFTIDRFTGAVKTKASLNSGTHFWTIKAINEAGKFTNKFFYIVVGRRPNVKTKINFKKKIYQVAMKGGSLGSTVIDLQKEVASSHPEFKSFFYVLSGNDLQNFHFPPAGSTSSLKVATPLNFKRKPIHKLTILAFDGSSQATCEIEIAIENDNENYLTASQACFEARVPENQKNIRNLITVPVTNSNRLPRSEYVMINNNDGSSPFVIDQHGTLNVKPSISFDRELQNEYIVTAAAGLKKENATFCVNVFVEDANDHKPNFTQNIYKINVLDSTPVGSYVMAVYATDKDTGSNARLSYSFQKENQYFGVDSKTGIVHVKRNLKDLANQTLTFMTIATDHGQKAYSGNAKLKIFVSYDHQRLEFSKPEYTFSISENLPKGTLVSDNIKINVSKVLYEMVADKPGDCSTKFWLGPFTAIILTYEVLDAEEFGSCTFQVVARVQSKVVSQTRLFITIDNINDNKPEFINASYTGYVTESMNSNTPVSQEDGQPLRVVAKDLDEGINGRIKYSFVEKLANIYFTIDERTGVIRTNFVLDCEKHPTEFQLNVKATDEGTPAFYSIVPLLITVKNINDRIPVFVDLKTLSVRLPAYQGMIIGRLKAKDYDVVPEELTFELPDQNEIFDIHPKSGDVFVKDASKLTNQRMLMVQAKVSDSLFHSIVSFQVQILRYKEDSTFKFIPPVISTQVVENQKNTDKPIGLVNPIGYLIGEQIHFRILNPVPVFKIGTVSGMIEVAPNSTFDREDIPNYEVHVEAWKVSDPQMVARVLVNVTVADENDNKPVFVQKKFYKAIDIDDNVGANLLKVKAVDLDAGKNARIRYLIISGNGQEFFTINPQTGQITLKKKFIKSKASKQYSIDVKASDHGKPSLSSEGTVEMFIINKDQPKFKSNYYGNIAEDAQIGDKVVTVYATGSKNRQVYYQIVDGDEYEQFHVGFTSGEVTVAGRLDHSKTSSYNMKIRAIDSLTGSWSDTSCDVTILDVNNHYPIFEKTHYVVDIKENVATGSSILKVSAHDQDIRENADITYTATSLGEDSMDYVSIDHLNGLLTLSYPLDAETKTNHLIQVTASDNGNPRKSSFTYVEIRVEDINDNSPKFLSPELTFTYSQYEEEAHFVGQVHAYDADSTDSLTYTIVPSSDYLMVARDTGSVYLKRDPSPLQEIKATVQVSDGLFKDTIDIVVQRTGSNKHAPEIPQNIVASVKENNAPKSMLVMKLEANDPDVGIYGNVTYMLDNNYHSRYFTLKPDGSLYTTDVVFDREDIAEFVLPVRAVDGGGLFTLANVTVTVQDENDCTPQFEFTLYEAHVSTSQVSEESLIHALAIDYDFESNSELKYVAHGLDDDSPLVVDNKTGLISLAGYAKGLKYQFSVQVSDNGYPILQSRTGIQVLVKRWDHRIFAFTNASYIIEVSEDTAVGVLLAQLTAQLKDYKGPIKYEFINGNLPYTKASDYFTIESGQIRLKNVLDYEKMTYFKLLVKARADNGESTNTFVHINVKNVNDNKPQFKPNVIKVQISEDTPVNARIIQVKAQDLDDPYGERLRYKIKDGDKDGMFSVDASSGWLYVKNPLDREVKETHKLTIQVSDAAQDTINTDDLSLIIELSDINDWPPQFTKEHHKFSMKENVVSFIHVIGQLQSHDKDIDSVVRYYFDPLEKSNRMFGLDPLSGVLTSLRPLSPDTYTFKVIAFDGVNKNSAMVSVTVEDIDDKDPQCLQAYYKINVAEDWPLSEALTKFRVKKGDAKDTLSFYVQGDGNTKFEVDDQGTLKAIRPLDYEQTPSEKFKIMVVDQSGHKCNSDIFLNLRDVNDNVPSFDQDLHMATVRENTSQAVVIAQVRATDLDSYNNRKLTYSIIKNNEQRIFAIDQRGIVTVNDPSKINRKKQPAYSLLIQAKDEGNPSLSSKTKLQIVVLSASDIPPKFQQLGYEFNITENNEKYAVVGRIHVTASKNLIEEKIVMSVVNDESGFFTVSSNDFTLKVKTSLDYEKESRYAFDLKAHYESIPTLSSTVRVTVQVNDQNDHVPQFKEKKFDLQVDENVRSGTFFLLAYAEDKDGSRENSLVQYRLIGGPTSLPFKIGSQSGEIRVDGSLDHEKINSYRFEIEARDNGRPSFSSTVKVSVNITDLNDNAPIIQGCHRVIVQERKPIGSVLLSLSISDVDSPHNGAPFSCSLLEGDSNKFQIASVERGNKCVLSSKEMFDKMVKDEYNVALRVADSGAPTQYSDCTVNIKVVEESYHPPVIQGPKIFYVIVAPPYGWTKIGQIKVFDEDKSDIHQYQIIGGNEANIFHIQPSSGVIEGKPIEGSYSLSVEVSDGKYRDEAVFKIVVNEFNEKLKKQSISVVINGVDVRTFVDQKMVDLVKLVAALSGTVKENVFIWSIADYNQAPISSRKRRSTDQSVVVAMAVKGIQDNQYIQPSNLRSYIENSRSDFQQLDIKVSVYKTECQNTKCPKNQQCVVTLTPKAPIVSLYLPTGYMSFISQEKCYCSDGSEGPVCLETNPCSHNPCKIGEKCVVTSTYFKCECMEHDKCDPSVDTVTLKGDSYISYQLKQNFDELFDQLSMKFRTEANTNEYLFHAYGKDFFILEIDKRGHIKARFDFGSGVGFLVIDDRRVNDGRWHHINVERYGNYVAMVLDEKHSLKRESRAPGSSAKININGHGVQIGAGLTHDGKPMFGFKGCIKEPKLKNQLLPFSGTNDVVRSVAAHKVDPNCRDSGLCVEDKCPRFSVCMNTLSSYHCQCLSGHYGPLCKTKLTCKDNPCQNNARCTYEQASDGSVSYKCTCKQGFTGGKCQIALGPCASRPCLNGGKCIAVNENSYICKCAVGFTGNKCSINTNPCGSSPCRNGGTCKNKYNAYQCICPPGKTGKQCSAGENCLFDKCLNGGRCTESDGSSVCTCEKGFFGSRCHHDVDECLLSGNCKDTTCVNTYGDYYCNCSSGERLKVCPIASTGDEGAGIPMLYLVMGGAGLLLLIIIVISCCCFWRKRKRDRIPSHLDSHAKYPLNQYLPHDGADEMALFPPSPPPRGELLPPAYYDETDQASAAMYDPSMVTFSGTSSPDECVKVPLKLSPSVEYVSEDEEMKSMPGYHWDYSEVPEDMLYRKMSREGSRILPTKTDQYYDDENLECVDMPKLPERPASRRSSMPGYSESEAEKPELPELPQQVRLSRQSLRSSNQSPPNINPISSSEFRNRYSLLSDENEQDASYLHDDGEEAMSELTRVTRPRMSSGFYQRYRRESESSVSDELDGYTETSFNSDDDDDDDDDDDATENDPLDPANTRKLERDIQKLIKDLQKRTEED